ncbi:hypothetical protein ERJ75_001209300 [Trypanosoma vivax]|nr:hypothetical protein ERJ75_001209300 [Trypanosoma vivax]
MRSVPVVKRARSTLKACDVFDDTPERQTTLCWTQGTAANNTAPVCPDDRNIQGRVESLKELRVLSIHTALIEQETQFLLEYLARRHISSPYMHVYWIDSGPEIDGRAVFSRFISSTVTRLKFVKVMLCTNDFDCL